MSQKSTLGKLLSTFRFEKKLARDNAESELWKANGLDNPTKRQGYEIRESSVTDKEANTVIRLELWKQVDSKRVQISVNIKSNELKEEKQEVGNFYE